MMMNDFNDKLYSKEELKQLIINELESDKLEIKSFKDFKSIINLSLKFNNNLKCTDSSVEKENIHNGLNYCHDLFYKYIEDCNNIKIESHELKQVIDLCKEELTEK